MPARRLPQLDSLPPLPYVAHEILLAVNDNDVSLRSIGKTLSREPGLTARIVAMANAAFFAGQRLIYSAEDAVVRLGLNRVRVLAASILLTRQFDSSRCPPFRAERYWYDAVGTAFTAARLSGPAGLERDDAAYLAGLLHNIGLLLLVYVFPNEMNEVLQRHGEDREQSLAALCRQRVGCDHHEAGRLLLTEWSLPAEIITGATHMHEAGYRGEHARLVEVIRFSAEWNRRGYDLTRLPQPGLGIGEAQMQTVSTACQKEQQQLEVFARLLSDA